MPKHLHMTHPRLGFSVTVEILERDGRHMASADLAEDSRDVGVGGHAEGGGEGRAAEPGSAARERDGGGV
jgi:hypothetical protein